MTVDDSYLEQVLRREETPLCWHELQYCCTLLTMSRQAEG